MYQYEASTTHPETGEILCSYGETFTEALENLNLYRTDPDMWSESDLAMLIDAHTTVRKLDPEEIREYARIFAE